MKLTIQERFALMQVLPTEADYVTYKVIKDLRDELSFSEDEIKAANIQNKAIQGDNKVVMTWNRDADIKKDVFVGEAGLKIIKDAMVKLDKEKKLNEANISIYEKFMILNEGSPAKK